MVIKDSVSPKLAAIVVSNPMRVGIALYQEALIEEQESRRRTPVKKGVLKGSHETDKPKISGMDISVTIRVGGPAAPYAVHVHENLEAYHPNGQAKFLESTIRESAKHMASRVGKRLNIGF